ncbi:VanZ family protein [Empedobacter stercoris]|uniref:VanZ family protein n=1 Tax=Empedobacter falsenii TaxID=343874 RepID=A0ABY8V521_9FLAO|nr:MULTISPECIES: VanZ family protein [Empedobacter]MCA4777722.1 VanZ family protein [Empedobacter stercoris]MCA4783004.1 VanZ family protein [Empedobacter stercoris]MCA4809833.1 VanZ family protein [Empedobacter stercoris]MDM1522607.1 VanZ family protein [Empedobacter sp. 225-1]QNT15003.1 VanZ family protein [Empedobacter stercoris]
MHKTKQIIFFAYVGLVFYLTLLPQENFSKLSTIKELEIFLEIDNLDKVVHCGMFGLMTILLFVSYKLTNLRLMIIPFLISFLIEILQGVLTSLHRSFDFVDLMANLSGIALAYIAITYYLQHKKTQ